MHWDTFKQHNYSTVLGDGDVRSVRYEPALLPPYPTIRVSSYSNCQRSTHSISNISEFQKFGTLRVNGGGFRLKSRKESQLIAVNVTYKTTDVFT